MEKWNERFNSHRVHQMLASYLQAFSEDKQAYLASLSHPDAIRLKLCLEYIKRGLASCVPYLVNMNTLDGIANHIDSSRQQFSAYTSNSNQGHLEEANRQIEHAVTQAKNLPSATDGGKRGTNLHAMLDEIAAKFEKIIEEHEHRKDKMDDAIIIVNRAMDEAKKELASLVDTIKAEKTTISQLGSDQQRQFGEAQEARRTEFAQQIKDFEEEVEEKLGELDKKVTSKFDAVQAQLTGERDTLKKDFAEVTTQIKLDAQLISQSLNDKDDQAKKLLEAVGIKTHTYGYAASANSEAWAAFWLRLAAIILMIAAVVILIGPPLWAILVAGTGVAEAFDWHTMLYRIPTALVVFVPAFYMASEANKHNQMRVESKRIELELTALPPFLEFMEQEKKVEIKEKLVGNYFVGHKRDIEGRPDKKTQKWLERFVPNLIERALGSVFERLDGNKGKGDNT